MPRKHDAYQSAMRKHAYWRDHVNRMLDETSADITLALAALADAEKAHATLYRENGGAALRREMERTKKAVDNLRAALDAHADVLG